MRQRAEHRRRYAGPGGGFTLIEVLIAVLVLSIGLLGLAALQTGALRVGQKAELRTRAVLAASDMVERMRANPAGTAAGVYDLPRNRLPRHTGATGAALTDLVAWRAELARLPGGQGAITPCNPGCPRGTAGAVRSVTVWWNAARDPTVHGYHCPPRTAADLRCVRLVMR